MSIKMFLVKIGSNVKIICCLSDPFFIRQIDEKYRSATAPLEDIILNVSKNPRWAPLTIFLAMPKVSTSFCNIFGYASPIS